ncbi:MAG: hypothetical protein AUI14_17840 [Actinobacteria bacterium 13_2_20CM_2_71_6]|nr:MAG: hypothetical protein AUI14_17840 [Actinobacteria bacterium 13_2_20CM_2_71_6]
MAMLAAVLFVVAGTGAGLARLAPVLLGPSPADRLAALERRNAKLAERNRLARELHDSVGHALSIVTVQATAADRVLDRDPEFARQALGAIAATARDALADLDHVLGLLREEEPAGRAGKAASRDGELPGRDVEPVARDGELPGRDVEPVARDGELPGRDVEPVARDGEPPGRDVEPVARDGQPPGRDADAPSRGGEPADRAAPPSLADLDRLVAQARIAGVEVQATVSGTLDRVPPEVSREAYRIVQEGLTNALRHAGPVPLSLRVDATPDRLALELTNPLGAAPPVRPSGGGRGLTGITERVTVLRGQVSAAAEDGRWRLAVELPLRAPR